MSAPITLADHDYLMGVLQHAFDGNTFKNVVDKQTILILQDYLKNYQNQKTYKQTISPLSQQQALKVIMALMLVPSLGRNPILREMLKQYKQARVTKTMLDFFIKDIQNPYAKIPELQMVLVKFIQDLHDSKAQQISEEKQPQKRQLTGFKRNVSQAQLQQPKTAQIKMTSDSLERAQRRSQQVASQISSRTSSISLTKPVTDTDFNIDKSILNSVPAVNTAMSANLDFGSLGARNNPPADNFLDVEDAQSETDVIIPQRSSRFDFDASAGNLDIFNGRRIRQYSISRNGVQQKTGNVPKAQLDALTKVSNALQTNNAFGNSAEVKAILVKAVNDAKARKIRGTTQSNFSAYTEYVARRQPAFAAILRIIPPGNVRNWLDKMSKSSGRSVRLSKLKTGEKPDLNSDEYKFYRGAMAIARMSRNALQLTNIDAEKYTNGYITRQSSINEAGKTGDILKILKKLTNALIKYNTVNPTDIARIASQRVDDGLAKSGQAMKANITASTNSLNNVSAAAYQNFKALRDAKYVPERI